MSTELDKTDQQRAAVALLFNSGVLSEKEATDLIYKISVREMASLLGTESSVRHPDWVNGKFIGQESNGMP
jgi:hypothetical protein